MDKTPDSNNSSFIDQFGKVLTDGIDYAGSVLSLLQAQVAAMALSSLTFLILIFFSVLSIIISFILVSVAFGIWLAQVTGGAGWALLIIGGIYFLLAVIAGGFAVNWLKRLNS